MEGKSNLFEPLLERAEQYGKTSFELLKLKSVEKSADMISSFVSRSLLTIAFSFFTLTVNIALALYLGDLLGKNYLGFLLVAIFYGLVAIVLLIVHPQIKSRINNSIITNMLN